MIKTIFITLNVAFLGTTLAFIIGGLTALHFFRKKNLPLWADLIFTLPMVLPPTVVGFLLLILLGKNGLGGFLGIPMLFTLKASVVAAFVATFPILFKTTYSTLNHLDNDVLNSARTLGLSERKIFFKIILPLSKNGIISGYVLGFCRALGEFGATIMVAGNIPFKTQTMSLKIYSLIQSNNLKEGFKWAFLMIIISLFFLALVSFLTSSKNIGENYDYKM